MSDSREEGFSPLVLVVGADPQLLAEIQASVRSTSGRRARWREAREFHVAVETARQVQPQAVLIELTDDLALLRSLAAEIRAVAPETTLIAVFRADAFPPETPESMVMIQAIRAGVQDFLRRPISTRDLEELLDRLTQRRELAPARLGTVFSLTSNKGGVGKSTLAVNLACGLARRHPERVLLVDASLQMGVCAALLDVRPSTTICDALHQRQRLDVTLLRQLTTAHESGLDLLAAPATATEAAEIDDHFMSQLLTLCRRTYDFVIVDTFPMLDRIVMAMLDLSARSYVVVENVVPTLLGAAAYLELLEKLGYDPAQQRVVVNRYATSGGAPSLADTEERLRRPVDFVVPLSRQLVAAANLGRPITMSTSRWLQPGRGLWQLVDDADALRRAAIATGLPTQHAAAESSHGAAEPERQSSPAYSLEEPEAP